MSSYGPVDVFSNMFEGHLKSNNNALDINNLNLLRNLLAMAGRQSVIPPAAASKVTEIDEMWKNVNKGCGCTKNKRIGLATSSLKNFIDSLEGKESLERIKQHYKIERLTINVLDVSKEI